MGKVIHLNTDIHALAKEESLKLDIPMGQWVTMLIEKGIRENYLPPDETGPSRESTSLEQPSPGEDPYEFYKDKRLVPVWVLNQDSP